MRASCGPGRAASHEQQESAYERPNERALLSSALSEQSLRRDRRANGAHSADRQTDRGERESWVSQSARSQLTKRERERGRRRVGVAVAVTVAVTVASVVVAVVFVVTVLAVSCGSTMRGKSYAKNALVEHAVQVER